MSARELRCHRQHLMSLSAASQGPERVKGRLHRCRSRGAGNLTECPSDHAGGVIERPPLPRRPAAASAGRARGAPWIASRTIWRDEGTCEERARVERARVEAMSVCGRPVVSTRGRAHLEHDGLAAAGRFRAQGVTGERASATSLAAKSESFSAMYPLGNPTARGQGKPCWVGGRRRCRPVRWSFADGRSPSWVDVHPTRFFGARRRNCAWPARQRQPQQDGE